MPGSPALGPGGRRHRARRSLLPPGPWPAAALGARRERAAPLPGEDPGAPRAVWRPVAGPGAARSTPPSTPRLSPVGKGLSEAGSSAPGILRIVWARRGGAAAGLPRAARPPPCARSLPPRRRRRRCSPGGAEPRREGCFCVPGERRRRAAEPATAGQVAAALPAGDAELGGRSPCERGARRGGQPDGEQPQHRAGALRRAG